MRNPPSKMRADTMRSEQSSAILWVKGEACSCRFHDWNRPRRYPEFSFLEDQVLAEKRPVIRVSSQWRSPMD
jgi:hypothetical protein